MTIHGNQAFRLGEWLVSPALHRLHRGEEERPLEPKVMQVLVFLASRHGEVVGHEELIERVWRGVAVSGNVVTYSIAALRKALEDDWRAPRYIETISKSGYRLIMPVEAAESAAPGVTATTVAAGPTPRQTTTTPAPMSTAGPSAVPPSRAHGQAVAEAAREAPLPIPSAAHEVTYGPSHGSRRRVWVVAATLTCRRQANSSHCWRSPRRSRARRRHCPFRRMAVG